MIEVELQESMGSDASIANAAWTSTYDKTRRDGKYDDPDKVADLVRRCAQDGHSVPFESVILRFWMRIPIFVDRQHMTHRLASHNGLSGRYRTVPTDFFHVPMKVNALMESVGINSKDFHLDMLYSNKEYSKRMDKLKRAKADGHITNEQYKRCREIMRIALPQANMVERTTIMNLRAWSNYIKLRLHADAQPEIQEVARQMLSAVQEANICPVALEALAAKGWEI